MSVGILAPAASRLGRQLAERLAGRSVWLDADLGPGERVVLDGSGVTWNGVRLDRLRAVFVHGFQYEDPVLPATAPEADWSLWQVGSVIRQQSWSFLYSVLCRLEAAGLPLYNPLAVHLGAFDRMGQLTRLAAAGLLIPALLCTNKDEDAASFQSRFSLTLWRPVTGPGPWQAFQDRQRRHLIAPDRPPVLLAAGVTGALRRAYVLDGRVVLVLALVAPHRDGVEQLEHFMPVSDSSPATTEAVIKGAAALGLRWGMLTYVAGKDGPVFYDADPDPAISDLPSVLADFLFDTLAATLAEGFAPPPPPRPELYARPALLLRRMLAIQFDMEQTKYARE